MAQAYSDRAFGQNYAVRRKRPRKEEQYGFYEPYLASEADKAIRRESLAMDKAERDRAYALNVKNADLNARNVDAGIDFNRRQAAIADAAEERAAKKQRAEETGGYIKTAINLPKYINDIDNAYTGLVNKYYTPTKTTETPVNVNTSTATRASTPALSGDTTTPASTRRLSLGNYGAEAGSASRSNYSGMGSPNYSAPATSSPSGTAGASGMEYGTGQAYYGGGETNAGAGKAAGNAVEFVAGAYEGYNNPAARQATDDFMREADISEGDWTWKNDAKFTTYQLSGISSAATSNTTNPKSSGWGAVGAGVGGGVAAGAQYGRLKAEETGEPDDVLETLDNWFNVGDGSEDDGTVICTELHRQGYMADDIYKLDADYRRMIGDEVYVGYRKMADPVVRLMKKSAAFTWAVSKLALPWALEMAHVVAHKKYKGHWLGKVIMTLGIPLCKKIGQMIISRQEAENA